MDDTRFTGARSEPADDLAASGKKQSDSPEQGGDDRPTEARFDELFDALSAPRRRLVAEYVDENGRATLRELAEHVAERESPNRPSIESIELSLHHSHVPRLVDAGLLAYDGDRKQIRRGDRFDAAPFLE